MQEAERMSIDSLRKSKTTTAATATTRAEEATHHFTHVVTQTRALEAALSETLDSHQQLLGHGPLGPVCFASLNSRSVAVKSLYLHQTLPVVPHVDGFVDWSSLVSRLQHNHIASIIALGIPNSSDEACLIAEEYCEAGCLRSVLAQKPQALNVSTRVRLLLEVAFGLEHLHHPAKGVPLVHRHLSSGNILLAGSMETPLARISHAAVSAFIHHTCADSGWNRRIVGTVGYTCPHYIATGHIQPALDLYSFGVLIMEMLTRKSVLSWDFLSCKNENSTDDIHLDTTAGTWEPSISRPLVRLAKDLICNSPSSRPGIREVVSQLKGLILSASHATPSSPLSSSSSSSLPNHHQSTPSVNNTDEKQASFANFQSSQSHTPHSQHQKHTGHSYSHAKVPRRASHSTQDDSQRYCLGSSAQGNQPSPTITDPSAAHMSRTNHPDVFSKSEVGSGITPDSDIRPSSSAGQVPNIRQNLIQVGHIDEARQFLKRVKLAYEKKPETYFEFLGVMKKYKEQRIGFKELSSIIPVMFSDEPRLSKDFEAFIQENSPNGNSNNESQGHDERKDETDESQHRENDDRSESTANGEYGKAIEYVHLVKARFQDEPQIYRAFFMSLQAFKNGDLSLVELNNKVESLFAGHPDLLQHFSMFYTTHNDGVDGGNP